MPPGAFETIPNFMSMTPKFNEPFLDLVTKYSSVIKYMHFGHIHTDSFRVLLDSNKNPAVPIFIAPAIVPGLNNNPSYRLINYDKNSYDLINYEQYFLNLTKANLVGETDWELEYDFLKDYRLSDLSAESLYKLQQQILTNETLFQFYYSLNSAKKLFYCDTESNCRQMQLCALQFLRFDDYSTCMNANQTSLEPSKTSITTTFNTTSTSTASMLKLFAFFGFFFALLRA